MLLRNMVTLGRSRIEITPPAILLVWIRAFARRRFDDDSDTRAKPLSAAALELRLSAARHPDRRGPAWKMVQGLCGRVAMNRKRRTHQWRE